ncbi:MAG: VCBS repeat-containing protein [Planctomycetota bacterium]
MRVTNGRQTGLRGWMALAFGGLALAGPARAIGPQVGCDGEGCGGLATISYSYPIESAGFPLVEFRVGTNDLDRLHYHAVEIPPGWSFTVVDEGLPGSTESCTAHGSVPPGPGATPTAGVLRWWAPPGASGVESFCFGFEHAWLPGDVGWKAVSRQDTEPPLSLTFSASWTAPVGQGAGPVHGPAAPPPQSLDLAAEELVRTTNGVPIAVLGYSVPSFACWDGDALPDLIVGEGSGTEPGKVRVYPNVGSPCQPTFQAWFYAQSGGADLSVPGSGCLGCFPRVVHWDGDGRKDLVVGLADGRVKLFRNVGLDEAPEFDAGAYLQVGEPGAKIDIDVGLRATATIADWDRDGRKDLVAGAYDARIHVFRNEGTHFAPDFRAELIVTQPGGGDLEVPSGRASPVVGDLDGDAVDDLLAGNTEGQLLLYPGPDFAAYSAVEAAGVPIDLAGTPRSRPSVGHWRDDAGPDVLIGSGDGLVRRYETGLGSLALEIAPRAAGAGETVAFTTHHGPAGKVVLLFLVDVGGVPAFELLSDGVFGPDCRWVWSTAVPPGFSGLTATFQAGGFALNGELVASNAADLVFE